jgi:hypothetical protein
MLPGLSPLRPTEQLPLRVDQSAIGDLDRFWEKERTKADVEVFILDEVFDSVPTPPFQPMRKSTCSMFGSKP